jgi:hypothetical protein
LQRARPGRRRVLLGPHGHVGHGHQARPARERLVHRRRERHRLHEPDETPRDRLLHTAETTGTWSAYPYTGPGFKNGPGVPVYATDGLENNALAEGMVVYRTTVQKPGRKIVDHLNPQTMD